VPGSHVCCGVPQGAVQGPEEFAEGFAIGVRTLLGNTVGELFLYTVSFQRCMLGKVVLRRCMLGNVVWKWSVLLGPAGGAAGVVLY